ncbi:Fructose-1,6-bisphosphatase/inositol-1-monophosphatase [uncultured archaeon]|nr:Fructose-1,6-bisphosphatase/inositol-1-monophosphatase [uncultured archaeon]
MDEKLIHLAHHIVEKISKEVRKEAKNNFYKLGKTVGIGADGTPTSYIDKVAEDIALKILEKSEVKVNLLSEEAGFIDFGGTYVVVFDPVDGTRNAYRGIPFYSVSLAIGTTKISDIEYGIVKNIPTGDVFTAEKHHGSFLNNTPIRVCDVPSSEMLSSISLGKNHTSRANSLSKKGNVRSFGSASLEMCMVAISALDYYFVGKDILRVVDIAASTLIVREAGGFVKTISRNDLDMRFNLEERTSVLAACSEKLIDNLLSKA